MVCMIMVGDCRERLAELPAKSVHTCVTSPPYFGLRDYGHGEQIGLEPTPDEFVAAMVAVFREVRRVLRDDGTVWLNLGDSYARSPARGGSGPGGKHDTIPDFSRARALLAKSAKVGSSDGAVGRADRPGTRGKAAGLAEKQLIGIPWRVAFALQADGWYLRQDIIWAKPNPMPESVRDRCTKAHEYIFLLSKSPKYYFDHEAIKEPAATNDTRAPHGRGQESIGGRPASGARSRGDYRTRPSVKRGGFTAETAALPGREAFRAVTDLRSKRDVWTIATRPYKEAHFATFPPSLIEPCVLAGAPPGGIVLDPFGGAGTTGLVAEQHGRDSLLIELNPEYAALARDRVGGILI